MFRSGRFAALKILTADMSKDSTELQILESIATSTSADVEQYVTLPLDHFWHDGPNGVHLCLLFDLMGPNANSMLEELPCNNPRNLQMPLRYPLWMAKRLLRQTLQGLVYLHANGIVHGDFQPGNMLFTLKDLSNVNECELNQDDDYHYGSTSSVERLDGKFDKWAPRYLAVAQPLDKYADIGPDFMVKLSDLGGGEHILFLTSGYWSNGTDQNDTAFFSTAPPKKLLTPCGLRAPEIIFGIQYDKSLDVWAFGCLLFEFIAGQPLFLASGYGNNEDDDDELLLQLTDILGPLPDEVYSLWPRSSKFFDADKVQFNCYFDEMPEGTDLLELKGQPLEQFFDSLKPAEMSDDEAKTVKSLLKRILQYDATKRPTAEQILQDPWFAVEPAHSEVSGVLLEPKNSYSGDTV